jgi:hypothetical protein
MLRKHTSTPKDDLNQEVKGRLLGCWVVMKIFLQSGIENAFDLGEIIPFAREPHESDRDMMPTSGLVDIGRLALHRGYQVIARFIPNLPYDLRLYRTPSLFQRLG